MVGRVSQRYMRRGVGSDPTARGGCVPHLQDRREGIGGECQTPPSTLPGSIALTFSLRSTLFVK